MEGFELVSAYTRADAIADGVLLDVTDDAARVGFRLPVAVTAAAHAALGLADATTRAQALAGLRLVCAAASTLSRIEVVFETPTGPVETWVAITGGDDGKPVLTVGLDGED